MKVVFLKYLFVSLIALLIYSCSDSNNEINLCENKSCGEGYECDESNGNCKAIEGFCVNNTQCKANEVCNRLHRECMVVPDNELCEKHEDCETWEICDFSTKNCKTRTNMCNEDRDCTIYPFLKCHLNSHKCQDPHDCYYTGCSEWEKCNSSGECDLIAGFCNEDNDCENRFPYTQCNTENHECRAPIISCTSYTQCNNWEICSPENGICTPEDGRCTSFLDCIENNDNKTECDNTNHLCKTPEELSCVNNDCSYFWRECNQATGICDLPAGRCDDDNDCNGEGIETCNPEHKCVRNDCTVFGCSWYKTCDESSGICNPRPSMCDTDNDCTNDPPYTVCNTLIHFCQKPESMECTQDRHCDDWEFCNMDTNKCELQIGYCQNNEQCSSEQECNLNDHRCYDEAETCLDTPSICNYWEECNSTSKSCELKDGYCRNDESCNQNEVCNYNIHKCENNSSNECSTNETTPCYTGSSSTINTGECKTGIKSCTDGLIWSTECTNEVLPVNEICGDNKDNDCDNLIDEGCSSENNFLIYYSERDLSDGKEWKFKNLNTNTYITVEVTGFSSSEYPEMKEALIYSFKYQSSGEYKNMVQNKTNWTYTELSGPQIYTKMLSYLNLNQTYEIGAYRTVNPWSSALAKTVNGKVYLNTRKSWDMPQYGDTITHELMHIMGFSHGDNSPEGKENSVPYFIGYQTKAYIENYSNETCSDNPDLCEDWETCNNSVCQLNPDRCNDDSNCNTEPKTTCNTTTHQCYEAEETDCSGEGICINSFPYHITGDTSTSTRDNFNSYNCSSVSEYGKEELYTFTLNESGTIIASIKELGYDIDIYLLSSNDESSCLTRADKGISWHLQAGTYYIVADTYGSGSGSPGPYELFVHFIKDTSNCAMKHQAIRRIGTSELLSMPATGKVVAEDHLVTNEEFGTSWPNGLRDGIENHYSLSEPFYQMNRSKPWCPCCEPSNEYGQGSTAKPSPEAETFYVNMRWASGEVSRGEKYIIFNAITGKAIVAAAGYENGPGELSNIGGASEEIHDYLQTSHLSTFTFSSAINQDLEYGPIDCN